MKKKTTIKNIPLSLLGICASLWLAYGSTKANNLPVFVWRFTASVIFAVLAPDIVIESEDKK